MEKKEKTEMNQSPEPEIKKKKRGRPSIKENTPGVPIKKKIIRRSIKVKRHFIEESDDDDDSEEYYELSTTRTPRTAQKKVGSEGSAASMQRIMLELPNLCDPNVFMDILMKTYGSRLEAAKVFECLKTTDLKEAVIKKFTLNELKTFLIKKNGNASGKFLTMASTEEILEEVQSREELRNSEKLLKVLLTNRALNETIVKIVLDAASVDVIVNTVCSRSDLKTSEKLFNMLLQNLPDKVSEETKKSIIKILIEKFTTSELLDISHEVTTSSFNNYQKNESCLIAQYNF